MSDNVLLIEDDPVEGQALIEALANSRGGPCNVEWRTSLSDGLFRLKSGGISVILLDLFLPDSQGGKTFDKVLRATAHVPILILSSLADEGLAEQACQRGAKDYVLKGHIGGYSLPLTLRNIIHRSSLEKLSFVEAERARVTLDSIGDAVLSTDVAGNVTYLNRVAETLTGWPREEAVGHPLSEVFTIIDGVTRARAPDPMEHAIQANATVGLTMNCVLIRRDGQEAAIEDAAAPIRDSEGELTGAVIVFRDVNTTRALALKMSHLAQHDSLTDLPNRSLLTERATQAITLALRHDRKLAILFLDLDQFKNINDTLGHTIGDKLLRSVGERIGSCVRKSDTVSRQGGDEFVVLLSEIGERRDATVCAEKILAAVAAAHLIDGNHISTSTSIGISIYPDDGQDAGALIKAADAAMYHAKEQGQNRYQYFTQEMKSREIEYASIEDDLVTALQRQEFLLHYQAQIDLKTGKIVGTEALIRWQHPGRGLLQPAQFIPIAEACGQIVPIGQWALREACRQTQAWLDAGLRPIRVAVNVSALEFRNKRFLENLRTILNDTGLEPSYLELELTESVLMQEVESTGPMLAALKAMGVQLSVGDFGTGYSSLSYLARFQIDALKIDKSFVQAITPDPDNVLLSAVINIARSLKHRLIAEGIETPHQLTLLQTLDCGEGQGYLFHRPANADQFAELMKTGIFNGNWIPLEAVRPDKNSLAHQVAPGK